MRTIRTEIRPRGYLADTFALMHPKMIGVILLIVTAGHFLVPGDINFGILLLSLVAYTFTILTSYRINEIHDRTTTTSIPIKHHYWLAVIFFLVALGLTILMSFLYYWWIILLFIVGASVSILYNADVHPLIHNRPVYGLIWGGLPLVFAYMMQSGDPIPSAAAVVFGIWASIVSVYTLWLWGPTTCGRMAVCSRAKGEPTDRLCHSPVLKCKDRLVMPKEVHKHMMVLTDLNRYAIVFLIVGLILFRYGV